MAVGAKWMAGFVPTAKQAVTTLIAMLATAIITTAVASYRGRQDNFELAFKNQELSQLQKFQSSGKALDTSFREFNDALSDKSRVVIAREKVRDAIAQHSSDALMYKTLLGDSQSRAYIAHLSRFRDQVDAATDATNAMPMAQTGLDLIVERQHIVSAAEGKIGIAPEGQLKDSQ